MRETVSLNSYETCMIENRDLNFMRAECQGMKMTISLRSGYSVMVVMDSYPMQLILHAIPIEWLRLKVNLLTFNPNHLIKNY